MYNFNINTAGFAIVGMFVATWAVAMLVWRYGHIEEKWSARLQPAGASVDVVPDPDDRFELEDDCAVAERLTSGNTGLQAY